ncbi:MAG: 30S ribosomal protein S9 [Candidatus Woesearchaeota archaeon]
MSMVVSGKRKKATARAAYKKGTGKIKINNIPLENYSKPMYSLKIQEPLLLLPEIASKMDISIRVHGGGDNGQAEAARLVIGKALLAFSGDDSAVEKKLLDYDRTLLVADVRRKEKRKPNTRGKARAKVQKSYR